MVRVPMVVLDEATRRGDIRAKGGNMTLAEEFLGMRIYASPYLPSTRRVQVRFPRSKKARIRKKFAKDQRNWKWVDATADVYMVGNLGFMHPSGLNDLRNRLGAFAVIRNASAPVPNS